MRIIAGEYRGRTLRAPKGNSTRPTVDRVRESLMSSILSARGSWEGAMVLDLFAGSGALGLEALSRGADFACFCEKHPAALEALRANTVMADAQCVRILRTDVTKRLPEPPAGRPFDLLFLDPPYAMRAGEVAGLIGRLQQAGSLAADAIIAYEHDSSEEPLSDDGFNAIQLSQITRKTFGATVVDLFRIGDA